MIIYSRLRSPNALDQWLANGNRGPFGVRQAVVGDHKRLWNSHQVLI